MYGNNANMYANMMGQQGNPMMGAQMGAMGGQPTQQMGQMPGQAPGQMPQLGAQQSAQQQGLASMAQQPSGNSMMASMPGMGGMGGMSGMSGMHGMGAIQPSAMGGQATGAQAQGASGMQGIAPGLMAQQGMNTGMAGQQGMVPGMMGQQGMAPGGMGQQGVNPAMANWQTMAAQNPQALATMAYMQSYAMRMAAFQRMAAAASAGGMGAMGAPGFGGPTGAMGAMGGHMGGMGMMPGMGMGAMAAAQHMRAAQQQQGGQDNSENSKYYKTRICNKWKDGHCPYGDTCKYAHGDADLRNPGDKSGGSKKGEADKRTMFELMKKTRVCDEFVKTGVCKYGDKCTFAHGHNELRQPPANIKEAMQQQQGGGGGGGGGGAGGKDNSHKTRLCERFMNTKNCPYGDKCTFAHGHHELRQRPAGGGGGGGKGQGGQQKQQKKQQQQGGAGGATAGVKREREEEDASAEQAKQEEGSKRQHVESEGAEGEGAGNEKHQEQGQDQAGASGAWDTWGNEGEGEGGSSEQKEQQQQVSMKQEQEGDGADGGRVDDEYAADAEADDASPRDPKEPSGAGIEGDGAAAPAPVNGGAEGAAAGSSDEPECRLCARMVKSGRDKMLAAVQQMSSPAAQKLGVMILGFGTPRFDQLWHKLNFSQLQTMLGKAELPLADRIELLKTVCFHTHASEEERERMESQKYVSQGLPAEVADFVAMVLDGKEGSAQMTEYFAALEVCKSLYGITEEEFFNVSSTMANLFMNM